MGSIGRPARFQLACVEVSAWAPDEDKHCSPLNNYAVPDVVNRFQVSPLMVSCFTCTAGWASSGQQQALLKATRGQLQQAADDYSVEEHKARAQFGEVADVFPPGPAALADLVQALD